MHTQKHKLDKTLESAVNFYLDVNINICIEIEIKIDIYMYIYTVHIHGEGEGEGDSRDLFSVTDSADGPFAGMYHMVQNLL